MAATLLWKCLKVLPTPYQAQYRRQQVPICTWLDRYSQDGLIKYCKVASSSTPRLVAPQWFLSVGHGNTQQHVLPNSTSHLKAPQTWFKIKYRSTARDFTVCNDLDPKKSKVYVFPLSTSTYLSRPLKTAELFLLYK